MAAPNIVNVTNITGNTAVLSVNTTSQAIVTNATNSNTVIKINTLRITNKVASTANISVNFGRSSNLFSIASNIGVPNNSSFIVTIKGINK